MKKMISILLVLIVLCGCTMLSSYGTENETSDTDMYMRLEPYTAYVIETNYDDPTNVRQLSDEWYSGGSEYYEVYLDEDVPQTITKEIRGKVYTLDYVHTRVVFVLSANQGNRVFHVYGNPNIRDPQKDAFIVIDAQTQQIVEWGDCSKLVYEKGYYFDGNDPENVAKTEVLTRAYLTELIGKELADQYEFVYSEQNYEFIRMINGKRSHERVYMRLDAEGTLLRYGLCNVGRCEGMTEFAFDEEKAMKVVAEAMNKLYPNRINEMRLHRVTIQKIPSEQMAYVYEVEVDAVGLGIEYRRIVVAAE